MVETWKNIRKRRKTSEKDGWTDVLAKRNNSDFLAILSIFFTLLTK